MNLLRPKSWPIEHIRELLPAIFIIFTTTVAIDQVSKRQVQSSLIFYQDATDIDLYQGRKDIIARFGKRVPVPKIDDFYFALNYQYSRNKGAAFSMFSKLPDHQRSIFFNAIAVIAIIIVSVLFMRSKKESWCMRLGLVLVLSGAVGNICDRLLLGYVIDFIDVEWHILGFFHDFAVFNVADIAINLGVLLYLVDILKEWRHEVLAAKKT